jgi:hypothetical protein
LKTAFHNLEDPDDLRVFSGTEEQIISRLKEMEGDVLFLDESYPYSAAQILQRQWEEGFTGGYTAVKKFVRKVRPKQPETTKQFSGPSFDQSTKKALSRGAEGLLFLWHARRDSNSRPPGSKPGTLSS